VKSISSRQNPLVRTFRALADDPDPTGERLLLDGAHLVRDAHLAGALFEVLVVAASRLGTQAEEQQIAEALDALGIEVIAADEKVFAALDPQQKSAIADDICAPARAKPEFARAAKFFSKPATPGPSANAPLSSTRNTAASISALIDRYCTWRSASGIMKRRPHSV